MLSTQEWMRQRRPLPFRKNKRTNTLVNSSTLSIISIKEIELLESCWRNSFRDVWESSPRVGQRWEKDFKKGGIKWRTTNQLSEIRKSYWPEMENILETVKTLKEVSGSGKLCERKQCWVLLCERGIQNSKPKGQRSQIKMLGLYYLHLLLGLWWYIWWWYSTWSKQIVTFIFLKVLKLSFLKQLQNRVVWSKFVLFLILFKIKLLYKPQK